MRCFKHQMNISASFGQVDFLFFSFVLLWRFVELKDSFICSYGE